VSVDTFWRRVDPRGMRGLDAGQLKELVPDWFDDRFERESAAGITLGVEDTGGLIDALLRLGAGDGPDAEAADLPVNGAFSTDTDTDTDEDEDEADEDEDDEDWDDDEDGIEDELVGVLDPEQVQTAAAFLARARPAAWVREFRDELAEAARDLGYRRPFDDAWTRTLVQDTEQLTALFARAAAAGEAIIVVHAA